MDTSNHNSPLQSLYGVSFDKSSGPGAIVRATLVEKNEEWDSRGEEGQLAVDVFDTAKDLVVVSTVAGASEEDLEIVIHNDLLTIRGSRRSPIKSVLALEPITEYFHTECFWGKFSRTIVLPHEVKSDLTTATLQKGVLVITLPKREHNTHIPITLVDD